METSPADALLEANQEIGTIQELEAALAQAVAQITEIRRQMQADDVSIRQSNAEYALLRAESQALQKQTESILARAWSIL